MKIDYKDLKLIYVLKVGANSKGENIYEFIFSKNPNNIFIEDWGWDIKPAVNNAKPPSDNCIDKSVYLKTDKLELSCLHESYDREYLHGYYLIHALAYEIFNDDEKESTDSWGEIPDAWGEVVEEFESTEETNIPVMVFHYGMSLEEVKNVVYEKNLILKEDLIGKEAII